MLVLTTLLVLYYPLAALSFRLNRNSWLENLLYMRNLPCPTSPQAIMPVSPPIKLDENATCTNVTDGRLLDDSNKSYETRCILGSNSIESDLYRRMYTPLERIILTANGNLQRLLSAVYNAPVEVRVKKCDEIGDYVLNREVNLMVGDQVVCIITGEITVHDGSCLPLVHSMGVGQIFKHLHLTPAFMLLGVGRHGEGDGCIWREYSLSTSCLSCRFLEKFTKPFI